MSWIETAFGAGLGVAGGIFSAAQANRFAERMSSSAHQREVADLRKAGLNPMLSANRGASAPQGAQADVSGGMQRGASTAMAVRMQKAQILLTEAQADAAGAAAGLSRTQAADISNTAASGRLKQIAAEADIAGLRAEFERATLEERKQMVTQGLAKAKAEVELTTGTAAQVKARVELLELARQGQLNASDFEKRIGEAGPAVKFFIELVRLMSISKGLEVN